jgi:hypothetical protein
MWQALSLFLLLLLLFLLLLFLLLLFSLQVPFSAAKPSLFEKMT